MKNNVNGKMNIPNDYPIRNCLVIGGCGFLGSWLVKALLEKNYNVRVFSLHYPDENIDPRIQLFIGDICSIKDLEEACKGVDTVFHTAAIINPRWFISKKCRQQMYDVNVTGTSNVISACQRYQVKRLIFTSSNNVVFDGPAANFDENIPYPIHFIDHYSKSKAMAEQMVLQSNNVKGLLTCALRPGAIYGPGDKILLPRVVKTLKKNILWFTIGNDSMADSIYVENLVQAHLLAADKLISSSKVAGQAYFISDDKPSAYFSFLKPLIEELGYRIPKCSLPSSFVRFSAYLFELTHRHLKTNPELFLSRMEAKKVLIHNYYSIEKAKQDLCYYPNISPEKGLALSMPYCKQLLEDTKVIVRPHLLWWIIIPIGLFLLTFLSFNVPGYQIFNAFTYDLISQKELQTIFIISFSFHMLEGFYAYFLAKNNDLKELANGWMVQTLLLGYPSLRLLQKEINVLSQKKGKKFI